MQKIILHWEDFTDGTGSQTLFYVRTVVGGPFGEDEAYNKRLFRMSLSKKNTRYHMYVDGEKFKEMIASDLAHAKILAAEYITEYIAAKWLSRLFREADQVNRVGVV